MQSPKNYLIALLALATVGTAYLAWHQYRELTELRGALLGKDERADWQKRLWAAEKKRADLEKEVAAAKDAPPPTAPADDAPPAAGRDQRRNGRPDFMAIMEQPEIQRLMSIQQKAGLDARYAALFKSLNLTPEQLDKFKNLLVEKRTAMMDVMSAAREQGINPRTNKAAFDKLVADSQTEIDAGIRSTLGDAAFDQYQSYEKTLPQRNTVSQLEQRLSYSSTPLTAAQSEQLVSILAATTTSHGNPGVPGPLAGMGGAIAANFGAGGGSRITDATINQSLGVLAGPQVDALKALQQEQKAQAELNAAMRDQFRANRQNGGTTSTTSAPPAPPPTPTGG